MMYWKRKGGMDMMKGEELKCLNTREGHINIMPLVHIIKEGVGRVDLGVKW